MGKEDFFYKMLFLLPFGVRHLEKLRGVSGGVFVFETNCHN